MLQIRSFLASSAIYWLASCALVRGDLQEEVELHPADEAFLTIRGEGWARAVGGAEFLLVRGTETVSYRLAVVHRARKDQPLSVDEFRAKVVPSIEEIRKTGDAWPYAFIVIRSLNDRPLAEGAPLYRLSLTPRERETFEAVLEEERQQRLSELRVDFDLTRGGSLALAEHLLSRTLGRNQVFAGSIPKVEDAQGWLQWMAELERIHWDWLTRISRWPMVEEGPTATVQAFDKLARHLSEPPLSMPLHDPGSIRQQITLALTDFDEADRALDAFDQQVMQPAFLRNRRIYESVKNTPLQRQSRLSAYYEGFLKCAYRAQTVHGFRRSKEFVTDPLTRHRDISL